MAALSGKVARIKLASQAITKSTDEAASVAPGGTVLSIDAAAKRHWARSLTSTPIVYFAGSTATPVGSSEYAVDYAAGTLTFATARSTATAVTVDVNYHTASYLGLARGFTVDADVALHDITTLGTTGTVQWRTYKAGMAGASVTLPRFLDDSTGRAFFDLQAVAGDLVLELIPSTGAGCYQGWGRVESDSMSNDIDGLAEETVTVRIDDQLSYTTAL